MNNERQLRIRALLSTLSPEEKTDEQEQGDSLIDRIIEGTTTKQDTLDMIKHSEYIKKNFQVREMIKKISKEPYDE